MKKSIRLKLFIGITFLITFFVLFSWLLNTKYLEKYYISQKTGFLVNTATAINQIYDGKPEDIYSELENLERNSGINIIIIDSSYDLKYTSFARYERFGGRRPDLRWGLVTDRLGELREKGSVINITGDPRLNTNFINLLFLLKNQDILVLSTPIAAIQENAAVANQFFLYTGLLTILIGSILAFVLAKQFTNPILKLNEIAQGIARLDFSQKYKGQSDDELGELGNSINALSRELHKSISELQEANTKLQHDIEQKRRIDEMRKEFVSSVSHELKTPISLIQGYAEGLKVDVAKGQEDKEFYCDVIIDEAGKMNKLVKDLLDLSQMESGYFKLEKSVFDISVMVKQTIAKFEPVFEQRQIKPLLDQQNRPILVQADIIRSEQVLVNYLNNAINHLDERKVLKIRITGSDKKVRISVFNSGKLIPADAINKIFTSFYKVDKARTRAYGGTGLGLSVVRAIQELDNNDFGAKNRKDGVEFWFELDRAEKPVAVNP